MTIELAHIASGTLIALAVTACVTLLGLQGTLDASAVTGILGAVVGIVGGASATKFGAGIVTRTNGPGVGVS